MIVNKTVLNKKTFSAQAHILHFNLRFQHSVPAVLYVTDPPFIQHLQNAVRRLHPAQSQPRSQNFGKCSNRQDVTMVVWVRGFVIREEACWGHGVPVTETLLTAWSQETHQQSTVDGQMIGTLSFAFHCVLPGGFYSL